MARKTAAGRPVKAGERPHLERVARTSADFLDEQIARLREIFPEAVAEGKVDWERLRATLGEIADDGPERYSFTWAGKNDSIRLLQTPSRATLVPCPEESVNWETTQHLFIEGDNLEVLKLLYKAYFGRVKMIYIDPPYNTGNDFVYPDNYADPLDTYLQLTGQKDSEGNLLTSNPQTSGRYHSTWLSMMYPRLFLARQLLREDGVIFVSIDDNEVHNLRMLMNEVFGEENFIATIIWQKNFAPKNTAQYFSENHDYVLLYARDADAWRPGLLPRSEKALSRYVNPDSDPRGPWASSDLLASLTSGQRGRQYQRTGQSHNIFAVTSPSGEKFLPPAGNCWRVSAGKFQALDSDGRVWWGEDGSNMPRLKRFLKEVKAGVVPQTIWLHRDVGHTQEASQELKGLFPEVRGVAFPTPKPVRLMKRMLHVAAEQDEPAIVLDFFAGTASTAHAVFEYNRERSTAHRAIMVQLPERLVNPEDSLHTIADIARERMARVVGRLQQVGSGQQNFEQRETPEDLGFRVFKLAESSFRQWTPPEGENPEGYAEQMGRFQDPLVDGWTAERVIYEVALKEGFGLSCQIECLEGIKGNRLWRVSDLDKQQTFCICLDDRLDPEAIRMLNLGKDDLFICRDVALDDTLAANLALQCRLKVI